MGKRTDRTILSRVSPDVYSRLTLIVEAYREAGLAMSVSRLCELYLIDGFLRDGCCTESHPVDSACAPEVVAAVLPYLEQCPHDVLVERIRLYRDKLITRASEYQQPTMRDPETVAAEVAVINAEP